MKEQNLTKSVGRVLLIFIFSFFDLCSNNEWSGLECSYEKIGGGHARCEIRVDSHFVDSLSVEEDTSKDGDEVGNNFIDENLKYQTLEIECLYGSPTKRRRSHHKKLKTNQFGKQMFVEHVVIKSCKIKEVEYGALLEMSSLRRLEIVEDWETSFDHHLPAFNISSSSLIGVDDSLEELSLINNQLWNIPHNFMCHFPKLSSLNLSQNHIDHLPTKNSDSCFQTKLLSLINLDMTSNSFDQLDLQELLVSFWGRKLRMLIMSKNLLKSVTLPQPQLLLNQPPSYAQHMLKRFTDQGSKLSVLDLSHNQISKFQPELSSVSDVAYKLRELYLQGNSISYIDNRLLFQLSHLLILNLSDNSLTDFSIDPQAFATLFRLISLDLSQNRIRTLERAKDWFRYLSSLQILNLKSNLIFTLDSNVFIHQNNLHTLILSENSLERVSQVELSGLTVLTHLDLSKNRLKQFRLTTNDGASLKHIDLSFNHFTQFYLDDIANVRNTIQHLNIRGNKLTQLNVNENKLNLSKLSRFNFTSLNYLDLTHNHIKNVTKTFFKSIPNLVHLKLGFNRIEDLEHGVFNTLTELRVVDIDNNNITDMNGILTGQVGLKDLNVSKNNLQWFDYAFIPRDIENLDISYNDIEEVGNYFGLDDGFDLHTFNVSHNKIKMIDKLSLVPSILHFDLSHNLINKIDSATFSANNSITTLDLRNNSLSSFHPTLLTIRQSISHSHENEQTNVYLSNNPLNCSCDMEWLKYEGHGTTNPSNKKDEEEKDGAKSSTDYPNVLDIEDVTCEDGDGDQRQRQVTDMVRHDFTCSYETHCFALCMCCDFFACDCRMQCPMNCSCFHDSLWTRNVITCSHQGHENIPPLIPMDATHVHLDGNNLSGILHTQAFIGRKRVQNLYLNNSNVESIGNQTFVGLENLKLLDLHDNKMRVISGIEFQYLYSLKHFYLHNNQIYFIHKRTFSSMPNLVEINLQNNLLTSLHFLPFGERGFLPPSIFISSEIERRSVGLSISLSRNEWECNCHFFTTLFVIKKQLNIVDIEQLFCLLEKKSKTKNGVEESINGTSSTRTRQLTRLSNFEVEHEKCNNNLQQRGHEMERNKKEFIEKVGDEVFADGVKHHDYLSLQQMSFSLKVLSISIFTAIFLLTIVMMLVMFKTPIQIYIHSHYGVRLSKYIKLTKHCHKRGGRKDEQHDETENDNMTLFCNKKNMKQKSSKTRDHYDILITNSPETDSFVQNYLLCQLEEGGNVERGSGSIGPYKICLQREHLQVKEASLKSNGSDENDDSVNICEERIKLRRKVNSTSTILLVYSQHYDECTEWKELKSVLKNTANDLTHQKHQLTNLFNLIIINLVQSKNESKIIKHMFSREMGNKNCTIINYNSTGFWNKLKFYLPDIKRRCNINVNPAWECHNQSHMRVDVDQSLDLLDVTTATMEGVGRMINDEDEVEGCKISSDNFNNNYANVNKAIGNNISSVESSSNRSSSSSTQSTTLATNSTESEERMSFRSSPKSTSSAFTAPELQQYSSPFRAFSHARKFLEERIEDVISTNKTKVGCDEGNVNDEDITSPITSFQKMCTNFSPPVFREDCASLTQPGREWIYIQNRLREAINFDSPNSQTHDKTVALDKEESCDMNVQLEPIYQTIQCPSDQITESNTDTYVNSLDAIGQMSVMLPNGQYVPATLVRTKRNEFMPIINVSENQISSSLIHQPRNFSSAGLPTSTLSSAFVSKTPHSDLLMRRRQLISDSVNKNNGEQFYVSLQRRNSTMTTANPYPNSIASSSINPWRNNSGAKGGLSFR